MASRIDLHNALLNITDNVYYQRPNNMSFPAIVYTLKDIKNLRANDSNHRTLRAYDVTIIDRNPDSPLLDGVLNMPYCSFDRHYVTDGLNHFTCVLYY